MALTIINRFILGSVLVLAVVFIVDSSFRVNIAKWILELEGDVDIVEQILESEGYKVSSPSPKLSITDVSLANALKKVIKDESKKYLPLNGTLIKDENGKFRPLNEGFIKVTVNNERAKVKNVKIDFRFLDPNEKDAINHCLPELKESRPGEILEEAGDLHFVDSPYPLKKELNLKLEELNNGEKDFWGKIKVSGGSPRYVCVEVQLNVQDDDSGEYEEQTSEHLVLRIHK